MELEDNVNIEQEIKTLEDFIKQEEQETKKVEEKLNPTANLGDEFDFFINFLHQLIINKVFKLNFNVEIIKELDNNLKKIIEKRLPNIANNLDKFSPEMAYIGTFATGFVLANADIKQIEQENKQLIKNDDEQKTNN